MTQVGRLLFGTRQAVAMAMVALLYVRGFLPIADMVGQGPFTQPVTVAKSIMPVVVGGYFFFLALWVVAGPIQRERTAEREVRRRR